MIIDLVIPSFKRKEKLDRCLKSIFKAKELLVEDQVDIYLYFDNNDVESYNYFESNYPEVECFIMEKQYRAFGIWDYHLKNLKSMGLLYLCDDTELLSDCLVNLFKEVKIKFSDVDGMIGLNQSNIKGSDSAMGLILRKFANRYPNNQCFCPDYVSFYADSEIGDYAKKLGKFHYCEEAKLIHYHPAFYKEEADEAHRIVRDSNQGIDKRVNAERKKRGLLWGESLTLIREGIKNEVS